MASGPPLSCSAKTRSTSPPANSTGRLPKNYPYSPSTVQKLEPVPPVPHDTFTDTFH